MDRIEVNLKTKEIRKIALTPEEIETAKKNKDAWGIIEAKEKENVFYGKTKDEKLEIIDKAITIKDLKEIIKNMI